jgi:glycosyltransferase involved in cell wall biosynthesis
VTAPLVSVITAVRNGGRYLAETIASVQAQTLEAWEYLIVDDCSSDDTANVARRAMAGDPRIRLLVRKEAGGPYIAANDAIAVSTGRIIIRTDGDDLQPPERFAKQVRFLEDNRKFRACVTYWRPFRDGGDLGAIETVPPPGAFKWYLLLRGASIHSSLCIERTALEELGNYNALPLSQDYRLWCELTRRGWLGVLPEALSFVRFHAEQSTQRRGALQSQLAKNILKEHWEALIGCPCSPEDVETLWAVGYSLPAALDQTLAMLDRWDSLWKRDLSLDVQERLSLSKLSDFRRRKLLRSNLKQSPIKTLLAAARFGLNPARTAS